MKKIIGLLVIATITLGTTHAQDRLTESDLVGSWKMVIEMDEVMEELEEEADDADNAFERAILSSVSGLVEGVMDNIQIYMKFKRGGRALVFVEAFDEADGDEDTEWYIRNNRLYINDTDSFDSDSDDYWVFKDGVLFFKDNDGDNDVTIYMVRMDD